MIDMLGMSDCSCCEDRRVRLGRMQSEPDDCYPAEAVCLQGASDSRPCDYILDRLHDMILDGQLVTERGYFADRDWLLQVQQGDTGVDEDVAEAMRAHNFTGAPYWFIRDTPDTTVVPFFSVRDVYNVVCGGRLGLLV